MKKSFEELKQMATAVRVLSADMVAKANSGHPGLPLGFADVATILFSEVLKYDAKNPKWYDRDRFILSAGHGSALLYSMLHMAGYDLTIEDLTGNKEGKIDNVETLIGNTIFVGVFNPLQI